MPKLIKNRTTVARFTFGVQLALWLFMAVPLATADDRPNGSFCEPAVRLFGSTTVDHLTSQVVRHSLSRQEAIQEVIDKTQLPADFVNLVLDRHIQVALLEDVRTQHEAQVAFDNPNSRIFQFSDSQTVRTGKKWFYRDSLRDGLSDGLRVDDKTYLPTATDPLVKRILVESISSLAQNRQGPPGYKAYYFNMDINGFKAVNDAPPSASYAGYHPTGDAVLGHLGDSINDIDFQGFMVRDGGDEFRGVVFLRDGAEALAFANAIQSLFLKATQTYNEERTKPLIDELASLDLNQKQRRLAIRKQLFRLQKDPPSISCGIVAVNRALWSQSVATNTSPYDLANQITEGLMTTAKHAYKDANGMGRDRGGPVKLRFAKQKWVAPVISLQE